MRAQAVHLGSLWEIFFPLLWHGRGGRNCVAVILHCGTGISSFSITWELVGNANYQFPPPDFLKHKLWGWGPAISVLTSSLGDSDILSLTEKQEYKFFKRAFKSSPVKTWRGETSRTGDSTITRVRVGPRPPDLSATPSRTHAPRGHGPPNARLPPPPDCAGRPARVRSGAGSAAGPSRSRACRPQPPPARTAPLSAPRAAPSRPRGVRTLGGWERRRDGGGKEEERGGLLSAGVGSCRRTPDYRPGQPSGRGFCGPPGSPRETTAPRRGGASPLAGADAAFPA